MAYEYGVNLKLDSEKALKDIDTLLAKLKTMEETAKNIKLHISTTNDIEKQQREFLKTLQQMQNAEQKLATQRQMDEEKVAQAQNKTATQQRINAQKVAQEEEKTANQRIKNAQKVAREEQKANTEAEKGAYEVLKANEKVRQEKERTHRETIKNAQEEERLAQQTLHTEQQRISLLQRLNRLQQQAAAQQRQTSIISQIGGGLTSAGKLFSSLGEIGYRIANGATAIQTIASQFVNGMFNYAQQIGSQILSQVENIASASLEQYETLETAQIGFANFFNGDPEEFTKTVRQHAEDMPGVSAQDLIRGIQYIAPQADGDSKLAIDAAEGVMKSILYSGNDVSTFGTNALQNLQQLASGVFTAADIRQMLRAMPTLPKLLAESDEGKQLLANGAITTEKLKAYIKENGQSALLKLFADIGEHSAAAGIYDKYANTLVGKIEHTTEELKNRWNDAMENNGVYNSIKELLDKFSNSDVITNVFDKFGKWAGDLFDFFQKNEKPLTDWANTAKEVLKSIGETFAGVVQDLVKWLGILKDDGSLDVEGLKALTKSIGEFIKGLVSGFGDGLKTLGNIIQWVADHLGEDGWRELGKLLGIVASPLGKIILALLSVVNSSVLATGGILNDIGGIARGGRPNKLFSGSKESAATTAAKAASTANAGVTIGNLGAGDLSFLDKAKSTASGVISKVKDFAGKAFKGAAIFAVGEAVTSFASDFVGNVTGSNSAKQVTKDLGDVASSAIALGTQFGAVAGGAAGVAAAFFKLIDAGNDLKEAQQNAAQTAREAAVSKMGVTYLDTAVDNLKKLGVYTEFEDKSEDAYEAMLEKVNEISSSTSDPTEAIRKLMDVYMRRYQRDSVASAINEYGEKAPKGSTAIGNKDAAETKNLLKGIYDKLVKTGIINDVDEGWSSKASGSEIWNYLYKNGIEINSKEFLTGFNDKLQTLVDDFSNGIESTKNTDINLTLNDGAEKYDTVAGYMEAAGFVWKDGAWTTQAVIEAEVEANKSAGKTVSEIAQQQAKEGHILSGFALNMAGSALTVGGWIKSLADLVTGNKSSSSSRGSGGGGGGGGFANGGFVKPIYRADGGGVPARGIDTVPAMLAPGEFVMRRSAVSKIGLGTLHNLNHGDLGEAARSLGARFNNSWNNSRSYHRTINNNQKHVSIVNNIRNRTAAGTRNSYLSLANRMAEVF